jgi:hypothetical protein
LYCFAGSSTTGVAVHVTRRAGFCGPAMKISPFGSRNVHG